MADYKQMYLHLLRSTSKATDILMQAMMQCEEINDRTEPVITKIDVKQKGDNF